MLVTMHVQVAACGARKDANGQQHEWDELMSVNESIESWESKTPMLMHESTFACMLQHNNMLGLSYYYFAKSNMYRHEQWS